MAQPFAEKILNFWFADMDAQGHVPDAQMKKWWQKDSAFDADITRRFQEDHQKALQGDYDGELQTPQGRLALIILVDQFSRQMFRDTPQAFSTDNLALKWCKAGLKLGHDQQLQPIQRTFFYLPLEHSEAIEDQALSVALFKQLAQDVPPDQQKLFDYFVDFAQQHDDIIKQFGRFPHRNAILKRANTTEEAQYLQQPNAGF